MRKNDCCEMCWPREVLMGTELNNVIHNFTTARIKLAPKIKDVVRYIHLSSFTPVSRDWNFVPNPASSLLSVKLLPKRRSNVVKRETSRKGWYFCYYNLITEELLNEVEQIYSGNYVIWWKYFLFFLFLVPQPSVGQGLLIHEVSRSHATTHHSR